MQEHVPGVFTIDHSRPVAELPSANLPLRPPAELVSAPVQLYRTEQMKEWGRFVEMNHDAKKFTDKEFKNGKVIAPEISNQIWMAMSPYLPRRYRDTKEREWELVGPSKYVMYASILPGQSFPIHTDTGAEYGPKGESKFTVLIYLNDDFEGGRTIFYDDFFQKTAVIVPQKGRTLIFDIDLFHAGEAVLSGNKKWIGTEIVCQSIVK